MKTQAQKDAIAKAQREYDDVREAYAHGTVDRNCLEVYAKRLWNARFPPRNKDAAPICRYCEKPLTDHDTDAETGGYLGKHRACGNVNVNGRYECGAYRFDDLLRAKEQAHYMADANYAEHTFQVIDRQDGMKVVYSVNGKAHRPVAAS